MRPPLEQLALLAVLSSAALSLATEAGFSTVKAPTCAGYPVLVQADFGAAPKDLPREEVSASPDSLVDLLVSDEMGGSALYINCGAGQYYRAVVSRQKLEVRPGKAGSWASLFIPWTRDRFVLIDGILFRPNLLPFSSEAPADFLIEHNGTSYSLPFETCVGLGLKAPLYRLEHVAPEEKTNGGRELRLELSQATFPVSSDGQQEYAFGPTQSADLNLDGFADVVVHYEDRLGSGRESYAAILLSCGGGRFAMSGTIDLGRAGGNNPRLSAEKRSICGTAFTTLVALRSGRLDAMRPNWRPPKKYDLYLYRPTFKDFLFAATASKPFLSTFNALQPSGCADLIKEANRKNL